MSSLRRKALEGLKKGDSFRVTRTFTEEDVMRFGDFSRDYNPVHYEERFAQAKGFPMRICHGLLVASLITEIGGQLGWLAVDMNLSFKKPVFFDDTVSCTLTITSIDEGGLAESQAVWQKQDGTIVLEASLTGIAPNAAQREVLRAMVEEGDPTNKVS